MSRMCFHWDVNLLLELGICMHKLQSYFYRQSTWKIHCIKLLYIVLKWKLLICICIKFIICNFNLYFNALFWIKTFLIKFFWWIATIAVFCWPRPLQFCRVLHCDVIGKFSNRKMRLTCYIIHKNFFNDIKSNVTSVIPKRYGELYWIPPRISILKSYIYVFNYVFRNFSTS